MALIDIKKLKIVLGGSLVLDDVNLSIKQGELALFIGTNGSGKTTLVRTILGLVEQKEGEIQFEDGPWDTDFVSNHLGYLPQYSKIDRNFPISVRELIALSCNKSFCPDPKKHLSHLDSVQLIDRPISKLSGGEFQRVMLARALTNTPKAIIYDEPTNNLDDKTSNKLIDLIKKLQKEGKAQIIITHDHEMIHAFKKKKVYIFQNKTVTLSSKHHV